MKIEFTELDCQDTPCGTLRLRRRSEPRLAGKIVYEIKLGDEFLMSSLFTESEVQLAKLEPFSAPKQESGIGSFQKNEKTAKEVLWKKMVRKVKEKQSNLKNVEEKDQKKVVVAKKINLVKNQTRRRRPSNLAPVSESRPFEGNGSSIQRRSLR